MVLTAHLFPRHLYWILTEASDDIFCYNLASTALQMNCKGHSRTVRMHYLLTYVPFLNSYHFQYFTIFFFQFITQVLSLQSKQGKHIFSIVSNCTTVIFVISKTIQIKNQQLDKINYVSGQFLCIICRICINNLFDITAYEA